MSFFTLFVSLPVVLADIMGKCYTCFISMITYITTLLLFKGYSYLTAHIVHMHSSLYVPNKTSNLCTVYLNFAQQRSVVSDSPFHELIYQHKLLCEIEIIIHAITPSGRRIHPINRLLFLIDLCGCHHLPMPWRRMSYYFRPILID